MTTRDEAQIERIQQLGQAALKAMSATGEAVQATGLDVVSAILSLAKSVIIMLREQGADMVYVKSVVGKLMLECDTAASFVQPLPKEKIN